MEVQSNPFISWRCTKSPSSLLKVTRVCGGAAQICPILFWPSTASADGAVTDKFHESNQAMITWAAHLLGEDSDNELFPAVHSQTPPQVSPETLKQEHLPGCHWAESSDCMRISWILGWQVLQENSSIKKVMLLSALTLPFCFTRVLKLSSILFPYERFHHARKEANHFILSTIVPLCFIGDIKSSIL